MTSEIEQLSDKMKQLVKKGHDQNDYKADTLLSTIPNIQTALQASTSVISDPATLTSFGDLENFKLNVSDPLTLHASSSTETAISLVDFMIQLMLVRMRSTLPEEEATEFNHNGLQYRVHHLNTDHIDDDIDMEGSKILVHPRINEYLPYDEPSLFQLVTVNTKVNPYNADFGQDVGTNVMTTGLYGLNGEELSVKDLPEDVPIIMYMFLVNATQFAVNSSGLVYSVRYNPLRGMLYHDSKIAGDTWYQTTLPLPRVSGESMHVSVRVNYTASPNGKLTAKLVKNSVKYDGPLEITQAEMADTHHDHRDYTFFVPPR